MGELFRPLNEFERPLGNGYRLLPFRFASLGGGRYLATNEAGQFITLDRDTLEAFVRHDLCASSAIYADLKSRHFLIDEDSDVALELLALKVRTKLAGLSDFTALHIFVVSLRCEHSCGYCQVSRRGVGAADFDMKKDTADRALDFVFRSPSPAIKIEFQGGEPILNFPMVQYIVEATERRNIIAKRQVEFVIATNLAVITSEMLDFCHEHNILISTSLDGPQDLHNRNRPRPGGDSYQRTIEGIQRARAALGKDRVSALMTTTLASLDRVRDIIDEYVAQDFTGIFLRPLSPYGFAIKTKWHAAYDTDRWLQFYFDGLDYVLELNRAGVRFKERYAGAILAKMLTPFQPGYVDLLSPAAIGVRAIVYNYDGGIFASDEARMLAEMNDKTFRLGNVHCDSYEDVFTSEALLSPLEESYAGSAPMCSDCAFEPFCGADPVFHHATQGDYVGKKPLSPFCRRNMAIFKNLINRMEDNETRRVFLQWAN
jgi:uncharacterized protein